MTRRDYVIGVDGGNSKTDYLLFDTQGRFVDHVNAGTCSHERFPDAYESAHRIMNENIKLLLERNRLSMNDVEAGAFGLAGADIPSQKDQLGRVVERIGFTNYAVDNDSFLGIKAASEKGYGICSINGSGTVTGGISPSGRRLQIGGVGSELAGDEAGGFYLARKVLRTVYDSFYRMGEDTSMADPVMELLGIPNRESFMEHAVEGVLKRTLPNTALMRILFSAADAGDAAAIGVVKHTARQLARSTAGCIRNLDFGEEVDVVLAGSVWIKAESPLLFDLYRAEVAGLTDRRCNFIRLRIPPATGAALWALELAHGQPVDSDTRRSVIEAVEQLG
ncbi:N-acetylglucosamine kinase [Cohnella endophytica]|uniref:N-acetylglucosamine kinase n=1 Tax=Cohnella endophytica TaxID=2419778 RepID=A0A494XT03_9BACL|nr:BadF/BadG/BcrA/BcrD ATPase family protein [Cohnella endophytica]RKP52952.1 N-acetylglucosamine kinase [Cohnella endophytica]